MASYKYMRHTVEEVDEAIDTEREHCADTVQHICKEERDAWNASMTQIARTNITSGMDLNTLDMGEGATASDFKLFVSTSSAITKTLLNLPPNFPYSGFSLEYLRISGQQWCQRITGATYSSTGNVTSMTVYYRAGVGQQPTVTWGGWFILSLSPVSTTGGGTE